MKSTPHTPPPEIIAEVADQVRARTPSAIIELIAAQLRLARNCRARYLEEGEVVRDMKGSVIPHPAIAVENKAATSAAKLLKDWAGR